MQTRNVLKAVLMTLFSGVSLFLHAQIKVEAEDFTNVVNGTTEVILEQDDKSIGYFDEQGEVLTYSVTIPEDGYYQFMVRYLAGKASQISIQTEDGSTGMFPYVAAGLAEWWTVPFASWFETSFDDSPLYYIEAGTKTFTVHSWGVGINIDYFQLQKSSVTSASVASVTAEPNRLSLFPGAAEQVLAYGYTADGKYIAAPTTWTANAPNGYYQAGNSEGNETITVTIGGVEKNISVKVANPTAQREHVVSKFGDLVVNAPSGNDWAVRGSKNGEKAGLMGPSFFWSCSAPTWWTKETVKWLVDDWHAQLIRCPVSIAPGAYDGGTFGSYNPQPTGTTWNPDNYSVNPEYAKAMMDEMVAAAIENDIYVIIDFHEHYADQMKETAIEFFDYFSKKWGSYPNVMYEIFNEPFVNDQVTSGNYATDVINAIRANDPDNIIIVGSGDYSRRVDFANTIASGKTNVACTWHGYVEYNHQGDWQSSWGNGVPVIVTEWGRNGGDDGGILQNCKSAGIINCPWSMHNKQSEGDANWSALVDGCTKVAEWTDADLSASGKWMRTSMRGYGYEPGPILNNEDVSLSVSDDVEMFLPTNTASLEATASTGVGDLTYTWTQTKGAAVTLSGESSATLAVSDLGVGLYSFKVVVTNGIDTKEKTVSVTVLPEGFELPEGTELIDDVEDNNITALWGGSWETYDDSPKNGASTFTESSQIADNGYISVDFSLDQGTWDYAPFGGVRVEMQASGQPYDLTDCQSITYKYKGADHRFRAESASVTDENYHGADVTGSTNDWKNVTVEWGTLDQEAGWGIDVGDLDKTEITKFSWQVQGATGDAGAIEIDDLTCVGAKGPQGGNIPPIVSAGTDQNVKGSTTELDGTGSFDIDEGPLTYTWEQVSGPSDATIVSATDAKTAVSGLQSGTYVFMLTVNDGTSDGTDEVSVVVESSGNTVDVVLGKGWNLVALTVAPVNTDVTAVFPNAELIKSDKGFFNADIPYYLNSIKEIEPLTGYLVYSENGETVTVEGEALAVAGITLSAGWNLVGVMSDINVNNLPVEVEAVKDFDNYYSASGSGNLETLEAGKAYFIKASASCSINW